MMYELCIMITFPVIYTYVVIDRVLPLYSIHSHSRGTLGQPKACLATPTRPIETVIMDWDDEYDLLAAGGGNTDPPFIDRVRSAPTNDADFDRVVPADPFIQPDSPETPLEQLMRHWTNERHCPDILPAQEELLANLLDHLRRQVRLLFFDRYDITESLPPSQKRCSYSVATHQHLKKSTSE